MSVRILVGDARQELLSLNNESVDCCVTSPPYYGLRDYGVDGQIGLESTPDEYVAEMVSVFREVKRILRPDGTLWLNIGDSYAGSGKGGNPEKGKQATNRGSQSVGVLYGKVGESARQATVANVTRRTFRPGADRADGIVDERAQRNRNGVGFVTNIKAKDLIGIPWLLAFALRADGWWLRQDIIWSKPNPMPESVTDRCTRAHEHIFMLSKSARYYYDADAIKEPGVWDLDGTGTSARIDRASEAHKAMPTTMKNGIRPKNDKQRGHSRRHAGFNERWDQMERDEQCGGMRNKRDVWEVATRPFPDAHFATFPPDLVEPCIKAGCPIGGTVLDPFSGAGTTALVADRLQRNAIGIELNPLYAGMASKRVVEDAPLLTHVS